VNKKLITLFFVLLLSVTGCTVVPKPIYIENTVASFDASTPKNVTLRQNSGFIGFLNNGNGIITENAANRYNNLIVEYEKMILKETGYKIQKNSGITPIEGDNILFEIDQQHLYYFILMNQWNKQKRL